MLFLVEEEIWRTPGPEPHLESLVTLRVPRHSTTPDRRVSLEMALAREGFVEAAGRRAIFFARLLDENGALYSAKR